MYSTALPPKLEPGCPLKKGDLEVGMIVRFKVGNIKYLVRVERINGSEQFYGTLLWANKYAREQHAEGGDFEVGEVNEYPYVIGMFTLVALPLK